ncbi:hypothetical protein J6590_002273 [Homalodisca vitripennis]|nr:hypothetical protein J6590_002273 [Homalodisca vitripennis]
MSRLATTLKHLVEQLHQLLESSSTVDYIFRPDLAPSTFASERDHNNTQYNNTQYNNTQYNNTQYNNSATTVVLK